MGALRQVLPYLKRYRGRIILGLVFVTVSNVFAVLVPRVIGETIDALEGNITAGEIATNALLIIGLSILAGIFLFLTRQMIIVTSRLIEQDLRNDFMRHVQSLSMTWYTTTTTGDIMALATNDIPRVREFVGPALMYSANTLTTFVFALVMMLQLDVEITLLALLPLPFVSYTVYRIGKKVHVLFGQVQTQYAGLTSNAQEAISGVRVIRGYVREAWAESAFAKLSELYRQKNMEYIRVDALMMPAMMFLIGLSQIVVLWVGGGKVIAGTSTIGEITQFIAYISMLIWPVIAIGWITNLVQRASAAMKRLNEVFDLTPTIADTSRTRSDITELQGKIEFRDVSLRYTEDMPEVLKNISFTVEPGETLAIVGTTGSGKSTIVNLIARLYEPTSGDILIDGYPIDEIPLDLLRSSLGTVTQETFLFSKNLADNVRFGRVDATLDEVIDSTNLARVHDNIVDFAAGYETMVGERGVTLSGGQKQRTSIARAILRRPSIMILDDALSAVDTETEERILEGLREIMKERTTIVIAHRISTVQEADKIIVLDEGSIIEQGTHQELVELGGRYAGTYETQLLEQELDEL